MRRVINQPINNLFLYLFKRFNIERDVATLTRRLNVI